jgi:DNA mismatch repair protein MLH3
MKLPLVPNRFVPDRDELHNATVPQLRRQSSLNGFTREDLRRLTIINQVDRKFIACRIPERMPGSDELSKLLSRPEATVILIDQHAADERIRVERFLKGLCMGFLHSPNGTKNDRKQWVQVKEVTPPLAVLLTHRDASTVMQSQDAREFLRKWGFQIASPLPMSDETSESESYTYSQILVSTVPEVVSDKVRATNFALFRPSLLRLIVSCCKGMSCGI